MRPGMVEPQGDALPGALAGTLGNEFAAPPASGGSTSSGVGVGARAGSPLPCTSPSTALFAGAADDAGTCRSGG